MDTVLVTGGAGFIGSHLVAHLLRARDVRRVTVLDGLTYAGSTRNLGEALRSPRCAFVRGDIRDAALVDEVVAGHDAVVHLAAESHVDRSFAEPGIFLSTNVMGTQVLLDAAARHGVAKFVHVSTDEVYGPLATGSADESAPLRPTVPYAVSKAAGDLVALSYHRIHGVPVCVTRSSNNYGPAQHPEKMIPLFTTRLLRGRPVGLHGSGEHVRNWLYVADHCRGIDLVRRHGRAGEVYNIGGGTDLTTADLTGLLLTLTGADPALVTCVPDRTCNDIRYPMRIDKITDELGYRPEQQFREGLAETVDWYRANPDRWAPVPRDPHAAQPDAGHLVTGRVTR
ncbi:dTDP-glucose 4,6-dehydratase [Saccharothrix syringae]|uniref:dTDP-glucose 4,6-dehydratase n=1 Tax=Saccharothrix syringae TaxID=103733 RepID=A0A5Q0H2X5_SACSY|nr:dTDP-glucose 4,6-dehydratase [Saccharothrix syringae]QFZ20479.1 dTDP-glucose 4,6-dehydratase [Saccharothrix syringae]